jgi:hypothetical protein
MGMQIRPAPAPDVPPTTPPPPPSPPISAATVDCDPQTKTPATNGIQVKGRWCYTLKPRKKPKGTKGAQQARQLHLDAVAFWGYKIGVKIKTAQTIEAFGFRGRTGEFLMIEDAAVGSEVESALPTGPDEKWVGFLPPNGSRRRASSPAPLEVCYTFRLVVSPVDREPQPVPIVVTYRNAAFATHYLTSIVMLSTAERRIRVSTSMLR